MKKLNTGMAYVFIASIITLSVYAAPRYESATILNASEILPPDLVKGPHHQVDERVVNDA